MLIPIALVPWPCGCVNLWGETPLLRATWHVAYACPWCDAVFSRPDLQRWMTEAQMLPPSIVTCRTLLRIDESVVEAGDECECCNLPLVRERTHGAKWLHLRVPMSTVEILRN